MQMPRLRSLPRSAWSQHPHWPTQTLLLRSHANFRRLSRHLIETTRDDERRQWIAVVYPQWIAAMRSHEAYEEHKLYPYLSRRWGLSFEEAQEGHQRLHQHDRTVREALRDLSEGGSSDALRDALAEHDRVLREHLDLEELLVIPALLELTPREFDDYCTLRLPELMRRLDRADGR